MSVFNKVRLCFLVFFLVSFSDDIASLFYLGSEQLLFPPLQDLEDVDQIKQYQCLLVRNS